MTSISPTEVKSNAPPTYDQAIYDSHQVPPVPSFEGAYPMETQPHKLASGIGMYPNPNNNMMLPPPQGTTPMGTHVLITAPCLLFGDVPVQCICPHCHQSIVTRIEQQTSGIAWLICVGILLLGCWLGCCLIPFCIDSLKNTEHYCPNCAVLLGTRRRM